MSWTVKPLAELADFCLGKMLDEKKNRGEFRPYLANVNVRWGEFDLMELREMRFEHHELERYGLLFGDIIMCEGGEPGRCAIWKDPNPGMMIQKALHRIRPNAELDNRFLYYSFLHLGKRGAFKPYFTGATIKHLPREKLAKVEIAFPALPVQKRIADYLSTYDDLIENNCRRIQLLEDSARLLYREWFVHLRFPGHEHVNIVAGVPEGWCNLPVSKICTDIKDSVKPEDIDLNTPYIGLEHIPRRSITLSTWETAEKVTSNKYFFKSGDIIFGKIRPYFHKIGFALCDGITSSDAIVIRPTEQKFYFYCLMYLSSDYFISLASKTVKEGSKMPRADWAHLLTTNVILPPDSLLTTFDSQISKIVLQLKALSLQNHSLIKARDLLLPRLMSGEISV